MKIIPASIEVLTPIDREQVYKHIEACGRVCYKSEDKTTQQSAERFISSIIKNGHEAVLEHFNITIKFICDRGVSHEIVRHRIASYCQESTRYCNYLDDKFNNEITVIKPYMLNEDGKSYEFWEQSCAQAETFYFALLEQGCTAQIARSVLPNSLKTEVVMTANIREWRHFFKLRTSPAAHPQMREVAWLAYAELNTALPMLFGDLT